MYPIVLLSSPAASTVFAPLSGPIDFPGKSHGWTLTLPDKSNSDACQTCLVDIDTNCEARLWNGPTHPECQDDWDFSLDRNDNALAFSGWINSADPHRQGARVFNFFSVQDGREQNRIDLRFEKTSGRMCCAFLPSILHCVPVMSLPTACYGSANCCHDADSDADETGNACQGNSCVRICTTKPFPRNDWTHVILLHAGGVATLYWNGHLQANGTVAQPVQHHRERFNIGSNEGVDSVHLDSTFVGTMLDLKWYNFKVDVNQMLTGKNLPNPTLQAGARLPPDLY